MKQETQFLLKGAEFRYPNASETILDGIDLEIRAGEWVALLGSNGSGKSTLLKLLSALLIPTQGLCFAYGQNTADDKELKLRGLTAMVFQNPEDQIVAATVEEEVAFGPENLGCEPDEIERRVNDALEITGLSKRREWLVSALSGGQKQRLALAGALAMKPRAIMLDEAMSMLDPRSRRDFTKIISEEHRSGMTIVEVTHRLDEIRGADRVIVLSRGKIEADLSAKEFFNKSEFELSKMDFIKPPIDCLAERLAARGVLPRLTNPTVESVAGFLR